MMTQEQAIAFIRFMVAEYGAVAGPQRVAEKLGIAWETVYAWNRRGNVPAWRVKELDRIKPDFVVTAQAAE